MRVGLYLVLIFSFLTSSAQKSQSWIDSTFNTMTLSEKIGQMFMIPVSSYASPRQIEAWVELIKDYNPGSIYIIKGGPKSHIRLVNTLQQNSKIPLLVGINAEWGLAQTLDSAMSFPLPIIQGAVKDKQLIEEMVYQIGLQLKTLGIQINFAPNADINIPFTSTVTDRYIGSDKNEVANHAIAFNKGLSKAGIITVARHLPGVLPEQAHEDSDQSFLKIGPDSISFYPYQQLINNNVGGLLTSHLHFSNKENDKAIPAPLSQIFISDIIKSHAGFDGLVFTEIPYLETITKGGKGKTEEIAFKVGNDILIDPDNIRGAIKRISRLVNKDKLMLDRLNVAVKKILQAKYEAGLYKQIELSEFNLDQRLNKPAAKLINVTIKKEAVTVLRNSKSIIPIEQLDEKEFALIKVGDDFLNLEKSLNQYIPFKAYELKNFNEVSRIEQAVKNSKIVIAINNSSADITNWIRKISNEYPAVVCHFGNPAGLNELNTIPSLIEGYDEAILGEVVAQTIFGALPAKGKLPVTVGAFFPAGNSLQTTSLQRLTYSFPEDAMMSSDILSKIDSIAKEAINIGAAPGERIMIARKGKVVFDKSYGYQNYDRKIPVNNNTIYDLASVTKVTATLQAVMFLYERGIIDLNKKLSSYLPEFKTTNKKDIILKDILTHQAGLWPYFPWHLDIMKDSTLIKRYFSKKQSDEFPFPVSENLFSHKAMRDSMWSWIVKSKLIKKENRTPYEYRYSDLGLYIMQRLVETITNQPIEDFVSQNFYEPLGSLTTGFHPLERFAPEQIAATENDKDFRKSLLVGYVHDPGSAMFGGVAGHAGLFSNANDLLKLGQMWLQKGTYGGTQYFKPSTIDLFTKRTFETSRRGLGWDKPTGDWTGSTGVYCSAETFGHTGFTGTCIWVDPKFDLVFVFLSNRVNPEVSPKLLSANIRTRIQDLIYQSIFKYEESHGCSETK